MYRSIDCELWYDPKIKDLPVKVKLLWLYLITCPASHYSGIYHLSIPLAAECTGLTNKEIRYGIDTLSIGYRVAFDDERGVIWVRNMAEKQARGSKQWSGIAKHLATLHKSPLIKDFLEYYSDKNIPYRYPIDTLSMGDTGAIPQEQEQEQDIIPPISPKPKTETAIEIPAELTAKPGFAQAWSDWQQHRRETKHALKPTTMKAQLKKLTTFTDPVAVIEQSISNGWQGLFEIKSGGNNGNGNNQPIDPDLKGW